MDSYCAEVSGLIGKSLFQSLDDYDVIGFDVDHCLAQYEIPNLHAMTYQAISKTLVDDLSYPSSIQQLTIEQLSFPINGLIYDKRSGYLIKIGENNLVLRAYHGFEMLTAKEIEEMYGSPPVLSDFSKDEISPDFDLVITYFVNALSLAYAAIHEAIKRKELTKTSVEVYKDVFYAIKKNFQYWDFDTKIVKSLATHEGFYPNIVKKPGVYVKKVKSVANLLIELRKKGKGLFLASNSNYDYCDLIMSEAYGADWRRLFDICITAAGKPGFFLSEKIPFMKVDTSKFLFRGEPATELLPGEYINGNSRDLEAAFENIMGRKELRFLYIGDHYLNDCYCAAKAKNWDSVAIVEELSAEFGVGSDKIELLNYKLYWGSHFYDILPDGTKHLTFWSTLFLKDLKGVVPNLEYLSQVYCGNS